MALIRSHALKLEPVENGTHSPGRMSEGQLARAQPKASPTHFVYASGIFASYVVSRTVAMPKNEKRILSLAWKPTILP